MTPEDKALELVGKMCLNDCTDENIKLAKKLALNAVDKIIKVASFYNDSQSEVTYWQEVVQEIETL